MKRTKNLGLLLAAALGLAACGSTSDSSPNATDAQADTAVEDTAVEDTAVEDTAVEDTSPPPDEGGTDKDEFGFPRRIPQVHTLLCDGTEMPWEDIDYICSFSHDGLEAMVYSQGTPESCKAFGGATYTGEAWIKTDGTVTALGDVEYDGGGNHQNDAVLFAWDDKSYKLYHSSFGWGWRKCHPPDCAVVSDSGGDVIEDGCTMDRTVPVNCKQVKEDGTIDDITVDTFEPCPGDPNYP